VSDPRTVLALRAIAARAGKAALDVEEGKLWPGQLSQIAAELQRNMQDVFRATQTDR
jgi:hypothetical protein